MSSNGAVAVTAGRTSPPSKSSPVAADQLNMLVATATTTTTADIYTSDQDQAGHTWKLVRAKPPRKQPATMAESDSSSGDDDAKTPLFIKVAVAGECAVGKTSMLHYFISKDAEEKSTIGVDYLPIWIKSNHPHYNRKTHVQLIDTAGQERFNSIVLSMFNNVPGIFLMFDAMREATFARLCEFWRPAIAHKSPNAVCMLVATKCDLYEKLAPAERWMERIDMVEQARLLGCEGGFHAISSRNGRHVHAMVMQMVDLAVAKEKRLFDEVKKSEGVLVINNHRGHTTTTVIQSKTCSC